ncbi:DUF998 domain-containing protein [Kutzneria buriramensis]|uniref:Uncharacterized protein DUF998 n=1 Tax=Kutzneria buriramensis TaxID=1045776 RepID=A0A3E0H4Y6_9PSEU|nr:DUF998 domain-containing protein [Kutzneria buriramensis]REH38288.1 uncharacterized protein DUF998 [Kutzneria buriramensis]
MSDQAAGGRTRGGRRTWALLAIVSFVAALLPMVYLHLESSRQLNPIKHTISDYVFAKQGARYFDTSLVALTIGSIALMVGLASVGIVRGTVLTVLVSVWCVGLAVALLFPTDPTDGVQSISGAVHRWAAIFFFPCLSAAGFLLARRCQLTRGWERFAPVVLRLALASTIVLATFAMIQLAINEPEMLPFLGFVKNYLGLAERILFGIDMALLFVLGMALWRGAGPAVDRHREAGLVEGGAG